MTIHDLKLSLIFFDNPISRFYLKFLSNKDVIKEVIIFTNYFIFKNFFTYKNFINNNSFPILFLNKKRNNYFISFVEEYFNLEKNFIFETYKFNNIYNFNIKYLNTNSINSINSINYFNNSRDISYLYTGREIIKKNILQTKKSFYHFHPGFIPEMRGADISLRSIFYRNHIGCSFFKINEKIDSGSILFREKYKIDLKSFKVLKNLDIRDFYKFWYSFIDPSIRLNLLRKLVLKKNNLFKIKLEDLNEENNYFSFLSKSDIRKMYYKLQYL